MGGHFTFGEASPPLGAFANDDQCDRQEGLMPQTCSLLTTLGASRVQAVVVGRRDR